MNRFIWILLPLFFSCRTYILLDNSVPSTDFGVLKTKKIALIGFKPFIPKSKVSKDKRQNERFFETDELEKAFEYGKHYKKFPALEVDKKVPEERVEKFIRDYIDMVNAKNAAIELEEFVQVDEKGKLKLLKRDVDYYLIGYHGPKVRENNDLFSKFLLGFLWAYSMSLVPYIDQINSDYRFILYDNQLNKISDHSSQLYFTTFTNWYFLKDDIKANGVSLKDHIYHVQVYKRILAYNLK